MNETVLCDPGLVMPPPQVPEHAAQFWARLVEWSGDHRLRLGPAGRARVVSLLGAIGWPDRHSHAYPDGMAQLAYRSLGLILGQALVADVEPPAATLSPDYGVSEEAANAIALDAAALHTQGLVALATAEGHWSQAGPAVRLIPPPPAELELLFTPKGRLAGDTDRAVARHLRTRRVTIVGGVPSGRIRADLANRFSPAQIRWYGSEPGSNLNLDPLEGLDARVDIVYCVTGHIGHAGSIKADKCCHRRGVRLRKVERASEIIPDLRNRHGRRDE